MELFALGSLLFWVVVIAFWIVATVFIDHDNGLGAGVVLVLAAATVWFFSGFHPINLPQWFAHNWLGVLLVIAAYVALAPVWAYLNWRFFFIHDKGDAYEAMRSSYQASYASYVKDMDESFKNRKAKDPSYVDPRAYITYKDWLADKYNYPPTPGKNKSTIFMWMFYWPISAPWTLIHKPVKRMFNAFYRAMIATYTKISQQAFANRFDELK